MPAILFGSIGTIADTSELQREAFNRAFAANGLDWRWERQEYLALLEKSGGAQRIAEYAQQRGETVDADAVHAAKSQAFHALLESSDVAARPGVLETVRAAREQGYRLGLVTTTSPENVARMLDAVGPELIAEAFDVVVDATRVAAPKPDPAAYRFALEQLGEDPADCVALEDNLEGVEAAVAADLVCVAFPNANTEGHVFAKAGLRLDRPSLAALTAVIAGR